MATEKLYMLAIMPPEQLSKEIEAIRFEFAEKYHCKEALKPPVHVTLLPPYKAPGEHVDAIKHQIEEFSKLQIPFPVTLKDYGIFQDNEVVYIKLAQNDLLEMMQRDLFMKMHTLLPDVSFTSYKKFQPHITIGYRDIPKELFDAAAFAYKQRQFFATFIVNAIHLWQHNGKSWQVLHSLHMGTMSGYA